MSVGRYLRASPKASYYFLPKEMQIYLCFLTCSGEEGSDLKWCK